MKKIIIGIALIWVLGVSLSLIWNFRQQEEYTLLQAARLHFEQIVLMREWNARLSGVYAPVSENLVPNAYLEDPLRDQETTDGLRLTKINPAMMTRQISTLAMEKKGIQFHITSLDPIRPQNKPTAWEAHALRLFEKGTTSLKEVVKENGERKYRYMEPLFVSRVCLKCHAKQGYREGDVRGGISITFPMEEGMGSWPLWLTHVLVLIIGVSGLVLFNFYLESHRKEVSTTRECLDESVKNLELVQSKLEAVEQLVEMHDNLKNFITTAQYLTNLSFNQSIRNETQRIVKRMFAAHLVCFAGKNETEDIRILSEMTTKQGVDRLSPQILNHINDVLETEVLTTCRIEGQDPLSAVIFPLKTNTPINEVIIIGHKDMEEISKNLLEIYLGIAGLVETMIHRSSLNTQMVEANKNLEKMVEERTQELNAAYEKMTTLANTDPLTKLFNRRNMQEKLDYAVIRHRRRKTPFTIVICDIDHFKTVNDQYGHDCGDYILTAVARTMRTALRDQDILARWGGEEFLFLLPDTDLAGGSVAAEKIRGAIEANQYRYKDTTVPISMTLGVCEFNDTMDIATCIIRADAALYKGKKSGRNRVCLADS